MAGPGSSELQTQELILAELKCRRGENAGLVMENQGLKNEKAVLSKWLDREILRGDKLETAVLKGGQIDINSQRMDANSVIIQRDLEGKVVDLRGKNDELTDDLRSCKNNQKWIAGISFVTGGAVGYYARGQIGNLSGGNPFTQPNFRPMPEQSFTMPNALRPASEFLKRF